MDVDGVQDVDLSYVGDYQLALKILGTKLAYM